LLSVVEGETVKIYKEKLRRLKLASVDARLCNWEKKSISYCSSKRNVV